MALDLNTGSGGEELIVDDGSPVNFPEIWHPVTMTMFANAASYGNVRISRIHDTTNNESMGFQLRSTGTIRMRTTLGATNTLDVSTNGVTGEWVFYGLRWAADNDRSVLQIEPNGTEHSGSSSTTTTGTARNGEELRIGHNSATNIQVAHHCIWGVVLSDDDMRDLWRGMHPRDLELKLGKGSLIYYQSYLGEFNARYRKGIQWALGQGGYTFDETMPPVRAPRRWLSKLAKDAAATQTAAPADTEADAQGHGRSLGEVDAQMRVVDIDADAQGHGRSLGQVDATMQAPKTQADAPGQGRSLGQLEAQMQVVDLEFDAQGHGRSLGEVDAQMQAVPLNFDAQGHGRSLGMVNAIMQAPPADGGYDAGTALIKKLATGTLLKSESMGRLQKSLSIGEDLTAKNDVN